jgi:rubrerythrin
MYDDLMAAGSQSLGDALKVGGAIEEIDILDLKESLEITQNEEIQRVYQNLLRGSENHLRAFTSNLERQANEIYQPQYLSQLEYDAILASSSPRGGRGNGNRP